MEQTIAKKIRMTIREARQKNESEKKRLIIILSSVSMIIVFTLWVMYTNLTLPKLETNTDTGAATPTNTVKPETGNLIGTFGKGFSNVSETISEQFQKLTGSLENRFGFIKDIVGKQNNFSLKTTTHSFIPPTEDSLPPTRLP